MVVKNLSAMQKAGYVVTSFVLVTTLSGCGKSTDDSEIDLQSSSAEVAESLDNNEALTEERQEEASSAVESAVTIMIDGAEDLAKASDEAKQTESYQEAKEMTKQNFDDLFGFLFQDEEIDGYTISDISDETVTFCYDGLMTLDDYIESYIPEYKDKAKDKLKSAGLWLEDKAADAGAWLLYEGSNLKEKTLQKYYDKYGNE